MDAASPRPPVGVVMEPRRTTVRAPRPEKLLDFVTPRDLHFVVAHLGIARVPVSNWLLRIGGEVERPFSLDYAELRTLPSREVTVALECAGNPLLPERPIRRVSNAVWRGVPITTLLERAGLRQSARFVELAGCDSGTYAGERIDRYVKDVPIEKVCHPDALVAYELNGVPLDAEHGFPARALVPGFHGTCSVKWLVEIRASVERHEGLFTTRLYNRPATHGGEGLSEPVWSVRVNSAIVQPPAGARLPLGPIRVWGWAWGAEEVAMVELSFDGGLTWAAAQLERPRRSWAWQRFGLEWDPPGPGSYEIVARAIDSSGSSQPDESRLNQVHRVPVTVE